MNKIWIFTDLNHVSSRWHENGGLVVVAQDLASAKIMVEQSEADVSDWKKAHRGETTLKEALYIFPDAGCC